MSDRRELTIVGLDVGGSAVKLGAMTADGERLLEDSVPVTAEKSMVEVLDEALERLSGRLRSVVGIGVGVPGLLDREAGCVVKSPNLPQLENVDLGAALRKRTELPPEAIVIENDANVAALGEQWLGAARGAENVLVVTLGSGIGGGLILSGELFVGEGLAGEVGHITIVPGGRSCGCGSRGCLEQYASASAAHRRAREQGLPAEDPGDLELLAERARAAAGPERALLAEIGRDLGHGLGTVVCTLDVRHFVFGGGFSAALDTLDEGIRRGLSEWAYGERVSRIRIGRAGLGTSAGWIGAARLVRHLAERS